MQYVLQIVVKNAAVAVEAKITIISFVSTKGEKSGLQERNIGVFKVRENRN